MDGVGSDTSDDITPANSDVNARVVVKGKKEDAKEAVEATYRLYKHFYT